MFCYFCFGGIVPVHAAWSDKHCLVVTDVAGKTRRVNPDGIARFIARGLPAELSFVKTIAGAVSVLVDVGSVAPTLVHGEGDWWGRWDLVPTPEVVAWISRAAAALPPAFIPQGWSARQTLEDMCRELTDVEVRRRTLDVDLGMSNDIVRSPLLNWLASVQSGEPVRGWPDASLHELQARIHAWRTSAYVPPYALVLRLSQGPDLAEQTIIGSGVGARGRQQMWLLELCLRSTKDPARVFTAREAACVHDAPIDPVAFLLAGYSRAAHAFPPLMTYAADPSASDPSASERLLTSAQAAWLVSQGGPRLAAIGVELITPPSWISAPLSLQLTSLEADSASTATAAPTSGLGMGAMVTFSWKTALGDVEISEAELREIAEAKAPLIKLRGSWIHTDGAAARKTLKFLEQQHERAHTLADLFVALGGGSSGAPIPIAGIESRGWLAALFSTDAMSSLTPVPAPAGLLAELRPYQARGLSWLNRMSRLGLGVVLADDMGLGKTVQLLALLQLEHEDEALHEHDAVGKGERTHEPPSLPTLVVCPMSVVGNWQHEAERFTPALSTHIHHGPARAKGEAFAAAARGVDVVITTYAILARDHADLALVRWGRIVLDEAQHIKNPSTRQAKAARSLVAAHRVALTGTPMENRLEDLRSILDFVNPGLLGNAASFKKNYADPIENDRDPAAIAAFTRLARPFILRREKTDPEVIADLPEKIEMLARANLTKEQAGLYQAVVDDMLARVARSSGAERRGLVLATLTRLKQVCNHPAHFLGDGSALLTKRGEHRSGKLALVEDILDSVTADGEKALLFTQFREFGQLILPWLNERYGRAGQPISFFHGQLSRTARERVVEEFQAHGGPPLLLLSLRAGGQGLNLTAASQVIHLDRWWNPAVERQATDRAYRIGQDRRVQVRKLSCVGTVEERIDALVESKQELAELIVGAGEGWLTDLDTEELRRLVELSADAVGD